MTGPSTTAPDRVSGQTTCDESGNIRSEVCPLVESPVLFDCLGERLFGMLHAAGGRTGVVIVVGGPQYRAGSHRQFVRHARHLAAGGHPVLRFDMRGMGDSSGVLCGFEQSAPDISAAIDALCAHQPQVKQVVLWGLCDGASAALLYLFGTQDPRVSGLCLLNPWVRSAESLARTQVKHYYRQRVLQREFWLKLLRGRVALSALQGLVRNVATSRRRSPPADDPVRFQERMALAWRKYQGSILLVLSEEDYTAREFVEFAASHEAWRGLIESPHVRRVELAGADHTFSRAGDEDRLQAEVLDWMAEVEQGERA